MPAKQTVARACGGMAKHARLQIEAPTGLHVVSGEDDLSSPPMNAPLLRLPYHALDDAFKKVGGPEEARRVFMGVKRHLCEQVG